MSLFNFGDQFGNPTVAPAYFFFAVSACLGTLQLIAARYGYIGLTWAPPRWQPWLGTLLGLTFISVPCAWFFAEYSAGIFRPGPAGLELLILFSGAALLAIPLTLAGATLIQSRVTRRPLPRRDGVIAEMVELPQGPAWLFRPAGPGGPFGAVCAVGTPGAGPEAVVPLATALAETGLVALAVGWNETDAWRPSESDTLQAAVSAATFLRERSDVDARRLGAVGVGLGGDVALQVAATDQGIRAVVAVGPWLDLANAEPGLSLLRDMTLPQAWRWQNTLRLTARQLDPLAHALNLDMRPVLLVAPEDSGPSASATGRLAALCRRMTTWHVPRLGREAQATRQIAHWLSEQLIR